MILIQVTSAAVSVSQAGYRCWVRQLPCGGAKFHHPQIIPSAKVPSFLLEYHPSR